jgi:hypothetical protein
MLTNIGVVLVAVFCLAAGVAFTFFVGRVLMKGRAAQFDRLSDRGQLYWSDTSFRLSLIIFWLSGALIGLSLIPAIVWVAVQDTEAGEVAIRMAIVSAFIAGLGLLVGLPGWKVVILQNDRIVQRWLGQEKSIFFDRMTRMVESKQIPRVRIEAADGTSIRVFKTIDNYDDFFNRLRRHAPGLEIVQAATPLRPKPKARPLDQPSSYLVPKRVHYGTGAGFAVALVFLWAWPWFAVTGEHPTRDSFIFMGIGTFMWLVTFLLVAQQVFQRDQPVELHLNGSIKYRVLRGSMMERHATELFSAGVETEIIYVKGQPGYRYPLYLRFVDGSHLKIDDFRARHLQSTTHAIGSDIRHRYLRITNRTGDDRARSKMFVAQAETELAEAQIARAIICFKQALAQFPDIERLQLYARIGDLHRQLDEHSEAISAYRAHVDLYPSDADAWQGLALSLEANGRTDLAAEAAHTAEQLLLSAHTVHQQAS